VKTPYEWKSGIAEAAQDYIALKRQTGMKFEVQERYLRHFDAFFHSNGFEGTALTKGLVHDFIYTKNERPVSHHNKEVVMRDFAAYLNNRGCNAYVAEIKTTLPRCKFVPVILTDDEARRLFTAIDHYPLARLSYRNAVDPVLFRFLYGTGTRISEALGVALDDVGKEFGTVTIRAAKNMKDRLIPMAKSLADRVSILIDGFHRHSDGKTRLFPGFHNGEMGPMDKSTAYNHFRDYLLMADIPHTEVGPRVHSFRHGFAVKCLKNWVMSGNDLTVMLPYLSAYMGHADFRGTQYYLRLTADLYPEILRRFEAEFGYVIPEDGVIYDDEG
jgi:integrase